MKRASDGKDVATMTKEMAAKGITVGKGFSQDELAAVYDGFATMKGKDLDAMNGVTLEKGTRKQLKGTDSNGRVRQQEDHLLQGGVRGRRHGWQHAQGWRDVPA
jgi:hypothetical protein